MKIRETPPETRVHTTVFFFSNSGGAKLRGKTPGPAHLPSQHSPSLSSSATKKIPSPPPDLPSIPTRFQRLESRVLQAKKKKNSIFIFNYRVSSWKTNLIRRREREGLLTLGYSPVKIPRTLPHLSIIVPSQTRRDSSSNCIRCCYFVSHFPVDRAPTHASANIYTT